MADISHARQPRGRPPLAETGELRARALEVLIRHGYQDTTMARIAGDVGMSVRTLHRHFRTKADIVWGGTDGAVEALRQGLERADGSLSIIEAITEVTGGIFDQDDEGLLVGRARLRLIATTPELQETHPGMHRRWRRVTSEFVARRLGMRPDDLLPRTAGAAIQTATMEALIWWAAQNDTTTPRDAVARAFEGLAIVATR